MHDEFLKWCDARIADCSARQRILSEDCRGDEARFMQIRSNVYGIFRSVYTALDGDMSQVLDRLASIPAAWEHSLAQAESHGEAEKAHIECIKLETADAIQHYATNLEAKNHD
ncbi:MAG: hypothetical protein IJZ74_01915 [Clostridia bacterium]|nr:hypothetical protein [Clostridia bacterium]